LIEHISAGPEPQAATKEFLTIDDVALLMGVSRRTSARWVTHGTIPSAKIGGRRRVRRRDLDALFDPTVEKKQCGPGGWERSEQST
jgi:excisionase family DNA binding protein